MDKEGIHTKIANLNANTRRHFDRHLSTSSRIYAVLAFSLTAIITIIIIIFIAIIFIIIIINYSTSSIKESELSSSPSQFRTSSSFALCPSSAPEQCTTWNSTFLGMRSLQRNTKLSLKYSMENILSNMLNLIATANKNIKSDSTRFKIFSNGNNTVVKLYP